MSMTIGERIAALRKGRGMTQEQLAEKLGVTRQSVSKWELDQATPEVACAVALCDLFGVSLDYVLRGVEPSPAAAETPPPARAEEAVPKAPSPAMPKPLTRRGYLILFGGVFLLACVLGLSLLPIAHLIDSEAVVLLAMLIFSAVLPLPAVYLAACRWHYPDRGHGFRHLWSLAAPTLAVGSLLLPCGLMLYLRTCADEYVFWSVRWSEIWYTCLLSGLFVPAILLPLLVCFHEKKWLCWVLYALSPCVFFVGMVLASGLTDLLPSVGKYGALADAAVRLVILALLALTQTAVYARLRRDGAASREAEVFRPLSAGKTAGLLAVCVLVVLAVGGGLYYALSLAGLPTAYLPLLWCSLPALLLILSRGHRYPTLRAALAETGRVTALFLPLLLAAHTGLAYLAQYLLTFGGPMPALRWGSFLLYSALSALPGGGIACLTLCGLRRHRWACGAIAVVLALAAVAAIGIMPGALY